MIHLRRAGFDEAYRAVAVAPYDFGLWDEPETPTTDLAPMPAGYPGGVARWRPFAIRRRLEELEAVVTLGGGSRYPSLHSSAATPFVIDDLACVSLAAFYGALQIEDEEGRRAFAAGHGGVCKPASRFTYRGAVIDVWSIEHDVLIARAVEAKVNHNAEVGRELAETGRRPIFIGARFIDRRFDEGRGGLWRAMPLALMLARARM